MPPDSNSERQIFKGMPVLLARACFAYYLYLILLNFLEIDTY